MFWSNMAGSEMLKMGGDWVWDAKCSGVTENACLELLAHLPVCFYSPVAAILTAACACMSARRVAALPVLRFVL